MRFSRSSDALGVSGRSTARERSGTEAAACAVNTLPTPGPREVHAGSTRGEARGEARGGAGGGGGGGGGVRERCAKGA